MLHILFTILLSISSMTMVPSNRSFEKQGIEPEPVEVQMGIGEEDLTGWNNG